MAFRAVSDRTPARSAIFVLLRGPPWLSVFSVVKPYLLDQDEELRTHNDATIFPTRRMLASTSSWARPGQPMRKRNSVAPSSSR
jgi:hypothetical protein